MKVTKYRYPKSSFLSMEKDLGIIVDAMMKNNRLKKYLYYGTRDCLNNPNLTEDESLALLGNQIKIVPKVEAKPQSLNYLIISFDNFTPNATNPEFRDNIISFDIICHLDMWQLDDLQLRPYKIAGEIDSMFNNQRLTGIGTLQFLGANQLILNDEFAGVSLMYAAIHGEEDKINMSNPADEESFIEDFDEMYN